MAFTEDFAVFFADFGVTATLAGGDVTVIFDQAYIASMGGQIDSTEPTCLLLSSDVTTHNITHGTPITINGVAYAVRGLQPDGTGLTALLLEDVSS